MRTMVVATLVLGLSVVSGLAFAQRVEGTRASARGTYETEVTVRSQSEAERNAAFARALAQVLGKLSGDRSAASQPGVSTELRRAADYVTSYDYRQDEGTSRSTGAPTFDTTLIVRFDSNRVDGIAGALGLPVWPEPRPKPVLWLAIDDGTGPRLVGVSKADAARSVLDRAKQRGYQLGLPSGTAAEQAAVGAIWRGDSGAIARLSARYSPQMQLIGKLYRSQGDWRADWIFVDHGRVLSNWSTTNASALQAMAAGADGAADAMVKRYAKRSSVGPSGTYLVRFEGIGSSRDYMRMMGSLQKLSVVRQITPVRAMSNSLELNLDLLSGLAGLRQVIDGEMFDDVQGASAIPSVDQGPVDASGANASATFRLR